MNRTASRRTTRRLSIAEQRRRRDELAMLACGVVLTLGGLFLMWVGLDAQWVDALGVLPIRGALTAVGLVTAFSGLLAGAFSAFLA